MSDAYAIRIADAVAAQLNKAAAAGSFSRKDFSAVRRYADWDHDFEDLAEGRFEVDVVFASMMEVELQTRGHVRHDYKIHVAVRSRFAPSDRDPSTGQINVKAVDPLVSLLCSFYIYFIGQRARSATVLDDLSDANISGGPVPFRFNQQALRKGLFEGYIELTFLAKEAVSDGS